MVKHDAFHLALGRFVDAFATAEHNLRFALAATAGVPREVAQAIFSGTRTDAAISFIGRLFEARCTRPTPEIDVALKRMHLILGVRNDLMHFGASSDGDYFTTSNAAHTIERQAKSSRLAISDLDDMTADLVAVSSRFIWMCVVNEANAFPEAVQRLDAAARVPLRYISPVEGGRREAQPRKQKRPKSA